MPGDGLNVFYWHIPILTVFGPETLMKVRLYCNNIDAYLPNLFDFYINTQLRIYFFFLNFVLLEKHLLNTK